jgi:hypothetical protein
MLFLQPWWYTWDGISAIGQWVGGIGAILAVFYASRQVRVAIKQSEEQRKIAMQQMEDNRKLVMQQIEEQRKIAMQQIEQNRDLVFKQIKEQRKISEEEREPKISIHTAVKEIEFNGKKKRVLIVTATNVGNVPVYLTDCKITEEGSVSFRVFKTIMRYKNSGELSIFSKHRIYLDVWRNHNSEQFRCKVIESSLPKSLVPGDFITHEFDLTLFEQKLIESYKSSFLDQFKDFNVEDETQIANALWYRVNFPLLAGQMLKELNEIKKEDRLQLYNKEINPFLDHARKYFDLRLQAPVYIPFNVNKKDEYFPIHPRSRMTTMDVTFKDSGNNFFKETIYISASLVYNKELDDLMIYVNFRSDDMDEYYYINSLPTDEIIERG